eukprot:m.703047 g.703047  ORF g.703047 m.703047 type:complete len:521 (-) comp22918_c0_seq13:2882-4444(-)
MYPSSSVLVVFLALVTNIRSCELNGSKPHIVFILFDDVGWNNVDWHRNNTSPARSESELVSTPHLARMLKDGIDLTRHYSYKMCSPSRSSIQSGRSPLHCTLRNDDVVIPGAGVARHMTGIASVLRRAGYITNFAGKWDAGMATTDHTPSGRGYTSSLLYFHHCVDYWTLTPSIGCSTDSQETIPVVDLWDGNAPSDLNGTSSCGTVQQPLSSCDCSSCSHCTNASDYATGVGRALLGPFEGSQYVDDTFAARAVAAVSGHDTTNTTAPLFLFWAPHAAHSPLQVPQASLDRFESIQNPWRRTYTAMLWHADQHVGTLRSALKENHGMWNNTLVVFASDNGGPVYNNGTPGASNYPLKGGKMSNWEGGIRVAAFVSGGLVPPSRRGTRSSQLSALWDWYGTFAYLAGQDPTDHRAASAALPPVDSVNLAPQLLCPRGTAPRQAVGNRASRHHDVQHVIARPRTYGAGHWDRCCGQRRQCWQSCRPGINFWALEAVSWCSPNEWLAGREFPKRKHKLAGPK